MSRRLVHLHYSSTFYYIFPPRAFGAVIEMMSEVICHKSWMAYIYEAKLGINDIQDPAAIMGSVLSQMFPPKPVFSVEQIPDLTGQVIVVTG